MRCGYFSSKGDGGVSGGGRKRRFVSKRFKAQRTKRADRICWGQGLETFEGGESSCEGDVQTGKTNSLLSYCFCQELD